MAERSQEILRRAIRMIRSPQDLREHTIRVVLVIAILCTSWVISKWLAHRVVGGMYRNTSWRSLNNLLENRDRHPITYYNAKADKVVGGAHVLLAVAAALFLTSGAQSAWLYLAILLIGDTILGILSERYGGPLNIRVDGSIPEIFQYLKEVLTASFFHRTFLATRQIMYAGFALLFAFLFLDDSLRYHEQAGTWLADVADFSPLADSLGVRDNDIGELVSAALPVAVFGLLLSWGYWIADEDVRRVGRRVVWGVCCLGFFGVAIDMLDRLPSVVGFRKTIAFIEDFGEMLIMSGILAFTASVMWRTAGRVSAGVRAPRA